MSKDIRGFFTKVSKDFNMSAKFAASYEAGHRIVPSRTKINDQKYQCRLDAGELINDKYRNVVLQVNKEATGTALKKWVQENGSHAKLATAKFDTTAADLEEEASKVLEELKKAALEKI